MRVLFAGGGTAGHINPAIAIAKYLKQQDQNNEVFFIGTPKGLEGTLVGREGFNIRFIDVEGLGKKRSVKDVKTGFKLIKSILQAQKVIKEFKPDYVVGTGGYVSAPVIIAAKWARIPSLIHEQNVVPGTAVKLSAPFVDYIAISFPDTVQFMPKYKDKCVFVGNPIRGEILSAPHISSRLELGFDFRPFVLIFGGSLGADYLNRVLADYIPMADDNIQFLIGTGDLYYEDLLGALREKGFNTDLHPNIKIVPYIHNMNLAMSSCDLIVSRAGAITISEITALGKPSVLIPSPNVAHNHQEYNAVFLEKNGASVMLKESGLTAELLHDTISGLLSDRSKLSIMSAKSKALGITNATEKIAGLICGHPPQETGTSDIDN